MIHSIVHWAMLLGLVALAGTPAVARSGSRALEAPPRCRDHDPLRRAHFGDLHVHTRLSLDATAFGTRAGPRDAYRFARGEAIAVPPYDRQEQSSRQLRIHRPLDFAAVTDHAEFFGELHICETEGLAGYDSPACIIYRHWPTLAHYLAGQRGNYFERPVRYRFCGPDGSHCREAARTPWRTLIDAAEQANDTSPDCSFTSFVGYEWTGAPQGRNLHRNVLFRSAVVPPDPLGYVDAPRVSELWRGLRESCLEGLEGCDVLAIPHNSNLSGGLMFQPVGPEGAAMSAEHARTRARMEPLVEIFQHKGESECRLGVGTRDELCQFEQLPYTNFRELSLDQRRTPPPLSFARNALKEGLVQREATGVNPFRFGFIGSTDTHFATPGAVDEQLFAGHMYPGHTRDSLPERAVFNPGGLAVLWAEENSREALFAAMRRREAYATSGPRMLVRFFGGWNLGAALCGGDDFAAMGYREGVPMGGVLGRPPASGAATGTSPPSPIFAVWALKDPGTEELPGRDLQRVQIIKGWMEEGQAFERVFDLADEAAADTQVDVTTCEPRGQGFESVCRTWRDPDFDPDQAAFYYARVVESPICRWTTRVCNDLGVDCRQPDRVPKGLRDCCRDDIPKTIQERAWTSAIWYVPD